MSESIVLVIGAGIGGLTAAIALRQKGFAVEVIERDPTWSVYGVGIIQQSNAVRAMQQLGLVDEYINAGYGFDGNEIFRGDGQRGMHLPGPRLVEGYPANVGISRPALHKVLGNAAKARGAVIRLGVTVSSLEDDGQRVLVQFSDGTSASYHAVVGADGAYSAMRDLLFPDAPRPQFTGMSVWRYNLPKPPEVVNLHAYDLKPGVGLVPLADDLMYMFVTTAEPGNPRYPRDGLAAAMRSKLVGLPPFLAKLAEMITNDDNVVYRPLDVMFLEGPWHKGRVALIGDAVHVTTPHLAQGAGMAIEDAIVLADELSRSPLPQQAFSAYRERRYARCRRIVDMALSICHGQLGVTPPVNVPLVMKEMLELVARPI